MDHSRKTEKKQSDIYGLGCDSSEDEIVIAKLPKTVSMKKDSMTRFHSIAPMISSIIKLI